MNIFFTDLRLCHNNFFRILVIKPVKIIVIARYRFNITILHMLVIRSVKIIVFARYRFNITIYIF